MTEDDDGEIVISEKTKGCPIIFTSPFISNKDCPSVSVFHRVTRMDTLISLFGEFSSVHLQYQTYFV